MEDWATHIMAECKTEDVGIEMYSVVVFIKWQALCNLAKWSMLNFFIDEQMN